MSGRDWVAWHEAYDDPTSMLARRLAAVRGQVVAALDRMPPGPVRVVSICAGQGRDLLGALAGHPRAADVTARLVELDPDNAATARAGAAQIGVRAEVVVADAGLTDAYLGAVPADLVLSCGVFGNITLADIERTVSLQAGMCAPGATLLWTRHRHEPDRVPALCDWYAAAGFDLVWLSATGLDFGVGAHRYTGPPVPLPPATRMFTFVGRQELAARGEQ
jgi:hypothetical protein